MYIQLKPCDQRSSNVTQVIARLSAASKSLNGIRLFLQPAQDIRVGARLSRTLYQYTLQDEDQAELDKWAPQILDQAAGIAQPRGRDVRSGGPRDHRDSDLRS